MTRKIKYFLVLALILMATITALLRVEHLNGDAPTDGPDLEASDTRTVTEEDQASNSRRRRASTVHPASLPPKLALLDDELGLIRLSPDELEKVLNHFPEVEHVENPDIESSPEEQRFSEQLLGIFSREQLREILPSINLGSTSLSDSGSVSWSSKNLNASATRQAVDGELIDIEITLDERIVGNSSNEFTRSKGVVTSRKGWILVLRSSGPNPAGLLVVAGADF